MNELLPKKLNAPILPKCWLCYDLGNYEIAVYSDGKTARKWLYSEKVIEDVSIGYCARNNVTEVSTYREHCEVCHPKFIDKHHELVSRIKDERSNPATVSEARHDLAHHWGLKAKRKVEK